MQRVAPSGPTTRLIDMCHFQDTAKWDVLAQQNIAGAFLKTSEGTTRLDPDYTKFVAECDKINWVHGAYHFFHPEISGRAQAEFFLQCLGDTRPNMVVIDWEKNAPVPEAANKAQGMAFIAIVQAALKKRVIVYGSPYYLQALQLDKTIVESPLWVAQYGVQAPLVPPPWTNWSFWQSSENANIPGIGSCDLDFFNGDDAALARFIASLQC